MKKTLVTLLLAAIAVGTIACSPVKEEVKQSKLEGYELYRGLTVEEKAVADALVEVHLMACMDEEEACKLAIQEVNDVIYEDYCRFLSSFTLDMDRNDIYDAIENGTITQEEFDSYMNRYEDDDSEK